MARLLKQSTAVTLSIGPFLDSTDFVTEETALTFGSTDVKLSKNFGAFASMGADPSDSHDVSGWYRMTFSTTDTNTLGPFTVMVAKSGALPVWEHFVIVPANVYDSLVGGSDNLDVTLANGAHGGAAATITAKKVVVTAADTNAHAVEFTGDGVGSGLQVVGGASGSGFRCAGGNTGVAGIYASGGANSGRGIYATSNAQQGFEAAALAGTGDGFKVASSGGIPFNVAWPAAWDAEVQSECADALTAYDGVVPADLPANFGDLAITVTTGKVTVGTNDDKTGYSISGTKTTLDALNDISSAGVQSACNAALIALNLDHLLKVAVLGTDVVDNTVVAKLVSKFATADWDNYDNTTDSLQAQADVCTEGRLAELDGVNLPADVAAVKTDTGAILTDTDEIGIAGVGLSNLGGMSSAMLLEVYNEVRNGLASYDLDHLTNTATGIPAVTAGTFLDQIMDNGTAAFDRTTDSLQAIRDRGDAAWTGVGSSPFLMQNTTVTVTTQTSMTLAAGATVDDSYNNCLAIFTNAAGTARCFGVITDYVGSTKTITLARDAGVFTIATGDTIDIIGGVAHGLLDATMADFTQAGTVGRQIDDLPNTAIFFTGFASGGSTSGLSYWNAGTSTPTNKVFAAGTSDDDSITFTGEIHVLGDNWQHLFVELYKDGAATGTKALLENWTQIDDRVYTVTLADTGASANATYSIRTDDGKGISQNFAYTRALDPPLVTSVAWVNQGTNPDPYPGVQTAFANGQTMTVKGTVEAHADEVYVKDVSTSATQGRGLQGPYTKAAFEGVNGVSVIAGDADNATAHLVVYCKVTGGANGPDFNSETDQAPATVVCSQTVPTFTGGAQSDIAYPAGPPQQEAIKSADPSISITVAHTNPGTNDTYLYDTNGTGELTIPDTGLYANPKTGITYLAGSYRETGTNYRLTVTRTEDNGLSATKDVTVKIANTLPVLTVSKADADGGGGAALDRMGSGAGTKDHTVYVNSTQANLSTHTPSLAMDAGDSSAWTGSWTVHDSDTWKRSKRVLDADINAGGQAANNFTWGACSFKNRAGKEATTITTNTAYSLGGFTTRTLNMGPIQGPGNSHRADIGVPVVDTTKTTVVNESKGGTPAQTYEGNVTEHNDADSSLNNYWTTVAGLASESFDDYTQYFHCSDKKFYDSVTAPGGFNVSISESET